MKVTMELELTEEELLALIGVLNHKAACLKTEALLTPVGGFRELTQQIGLLLELMKVQLEKQL